MNIRNRIKELREVAADEVAPNPRNWRTHPQHQRDALRGVLADIGIAAPVIAYHSERHNGLMLIDGHERMTVGVPFPAVILDVSDAEADTLLATFDPITSLATADAEKLDALLREVSSDSPAVQQMLDDLAQEHGIVPCVVPGGGGDEFDATPNDAGPTRAELGDLWLIGGVHRLICGDSTDPATVERLMQGERADAVVTDSPYGINQDGITNDGPEGLRNLFDGVLRALPLENGVMVNFQSTRLFPAWLDAVRAAGHKFERMLWMYKAAQNTYPWRGWLLTSEAILTTTKGEAQWNDHHPYAHDCYYLSEVSGEIPEGLGWHASVKPMSVITDIAQRVSTAGALLYDPFLGSGTTLIAAHRTGRRCYGMEIEPRYADVILRRAEAEGLSVELAERSTESIHGAQAHE